MSLYFSSSYKPCLSECLVFLFMNFSFLKGIVEEIMTTFMSIIQIECDTAYTELGMVPASDWLVRNMLSLFLL